MTILYPVSDINSRRHVKHGWKFIGELVFFPFILFRYIIKFLVVISKKIIQKQ